MIFQSKISNSSNVSSSINSSTRNVDDGQSDCSLMDQTLFTSLPCGDLEVDYQSHWNSGPLVITQYMYNDKPPIMKYQPFEGTNFAVFQDPNCFLETKQPIQFANLSSSTLYTKQFLNLYLFVDILSPNSTAYVSVKLNQTEIARLDQTTLSKTPITSNYQYRLVSIDVTSYANGSLNTLSFHFIGLYGNQNLFFIDYINFVSIPSNYIASDLYISMYGDDMKGDGTINKPFCNLQRAIDLIESGYTIYLMSNITYHPQILTSTYGFDTLGKNLTITNYNTTHALITPSNNVQLALVSYGSLVVNNIFVQNTVTNRYGKAGCFTVSTPAQLFLYNCQFSNNTDSNPSVGAAYLIHAQIDATIQINNSYIYDNSGNTFQFINDIVNINNTTLELNIIGTLFTLNNPYLNFYLTNSLLMNNLNLLNAYHFNLVEISNCSFTDNYILNDGNILEFGGSLFIHECFFARNILRLELLNIDNVTISNTVFSTNSFSKTTMITITNYGGQSIIMSNVEFSFTSISSDPIISLASGGYSALNNITFNSNQSPLLQTRDTDLTVNQLNVNFNSKASYLFTFNGGSAIIFKMMACNNVCPLMSGFNSEITVHNSDFLQNTNQQYITIPFIYLLYPVYAEFRKITIQENYNFQIFQCDQGQEVTLESVGFFNNSIGELLTFSQTTVQIHSIQMEHNFLATNYPISVDQSQLSMINANFLDNTQFLYISNSTFHLDDCYWQQINVIDGIEAFSIINSTGSIINSGIFYTLPSPGIYILKSNVVIGATDFYQLYAFDTPLGNIIDSFVIFNYTSFSGCSCGKNMMMILSSTVTFYHAEFYNLTSPGTSLFRSYLSTVNISHCSLVENRGGLYGINSMQSEIYIDNSLFNQNFYEIGFIFFVQGGTFYMEDSNIQNNWLAIKFGGNFAPKATFQRVTFTLNTPKNELIQVESSLLSIYNCKFEWNGSPHSQSIISLYNSVLIIQGTTIIFHQLIPTYSTIISLQATDATISDSQFSLNKAAYGCIYAIDSMKNLIQITNTSFFNNSATSGAALNAWSAANIYVSNSKFVNNIVDRPASLKQLHQDSHSGGAIVLAGSNMWSYGNSYINNVAPKSGGAVFLKDYGFALFMNDIFQYNIVEFGGGACCYDSSNAGQCIIGQCSNPMDCVTSKNNTLNYNFAAYGIIAATGPVNISTQLINTNSIHPNTSFTVRIGVFDHYNQLVSILTSSVTVNLTIYVDLNGTLEYVDKRVTESTMQGWVDNTFTLNYPIGTPVIFSSNTSIGYKSTFISILSICPPGFFTEVDTNSCSLCPVGTYGWDGQTCYLCSQIGIDKVRCPGGNSITTMPGFYLLPEVYPPEIYECAPSICQFNQCRTHQSGLLCSQCDHDYFKVKSYCEYCPSGSVNYYLIIGFALFFILYFLVLSAYTVPSATVIFNFLLCIQVVAVMSFDIRYVAILPLFNFEIDYWPANCMSPILNFAWKNIISVTMIITMILLCSTCKLGRFISRRFLWKYLSEFLETFKGNIGYALFSHLITLYTPLAFVSLSLVSCYQIGDDYYLSLDVSIRCFTSQHTPLFILALFIIVFVIVGVPVLIVAQIIKKNRNFLKMFFGKYRYNYIWWDIVLMIRSLFFIFTTISTVYHLDTKALFLSTFGLFFTCLNWLLSPHKEKHHNEVETHFGLILCICAMVFNSRALDNASFISGMIISAIGVLTTISLCYYFYSMVKLHKRLKNETQLI